MLRYLIKSYHDRTFLDHRFYYTLVYDMIFDMIANENPNPNNTITLEALEAIIKGVLELNDEQCQFADDMAKYLDGNFVTTIGDEFILTVLKHIDNCFAHGGAANPNNDILTWWLWDSPRAGKNPEYCYIMDENNNKYSVETIPLLYEYLTTGKTNVLLHSS